MIVHGLDFIFTLKNFINNLINGFNKKKNWHLKNYKKKKGLIIYRKFTWANLIKVILN